MHVISRRNLVTTFAGFAAAAAVNPFPNIVSVVAQQASPTADTREPAESQVLRWMDAPPPGLSVSAYSAAFWNAFLQNVYMTPFVQLSSGEIAEGICSSYTVSDDLLTYTFTINPKAIWSDGTKVTANDIKASWEWMANTAVSNNVFNYYQTQVVVGNEDVVSGKTTDMSGLKVVDDDTLEITLKQPYTPFIYYCTDCLLLAHQKANIESGADWDQRPTVASGPMMVESFDANAGTVTLIKNPNWWGQKTTIERVELVPITDASTQLLTWQSDQVDVWGEWGIGTDQARSIDRAELKNAYPGNGFLLLNTQQPPFDDVHMRRAVQRATDVATIVPVVYGDWQLPATGITHPTDPAYLERAPLLDIEAAKAELAQSKYASGAIPAPVAVLAAGDWVKVGAMMQQMLKDALDIDLQVVAADQASLEQTNSAAIGAGGNGVLYWGPGGLLSWGWHKDNYWFNGPIHAVDQEIEDLLNQGDALPDDQLDERIKIYQQAEQLILDRAYMIPVTWSSVELGKTPPNPGLPTRAGTQT